MADAAALRTALTAALGLRGEVRKHREIHLWHNVRIHLDRVAGLGSFVEFEAVLAPEEAEGLSLTRLEQLGAALGLSGAERIAGSYIDLIASGE